LVNTGPAAKTTTKASKNGHLPNWVFELHGVFIKEATLQNSTVPATPLVVVDTTKGVAS